MQERYFSASVQIITCEVVSAARLKLMKRSRTVPKENCLKKRGSLQMNYHFFTVISGAEVHYTYPNGDEVSNIEIVYLCNQFHGKMKAQQEEFEELKFFKPSEIDIDMISPPLRLTIRKYLDTYRVDVF